MTSTKEPIYQGLSPANGEQLPPFSPGEERRFELEIGVLDGRAAISAFEREVEALATPAGGTHG